MYFNDECSQFVFDVTFKQLSNFLKLKIKFVNLFSEIQNIQSTTMFY